MILLNVAVLLLAVVVLAVAALWILAWNTGDYIERSNVFADDGLRYWYRVKRHHWLPRLTPWHEAAITIGDQVFCLDTCPATLEAHEFYHVTRNKRYGRVQRFLLYFRDTLTLGYYKSHEETAARWYSARHWQDFHPPLDTH